MRTLRALVCPSCGLSLPAAEPGAHVLCEHCDAETDLPALGPAWREHVDIDDDEDETSNAPMLAGCAGLALALAVMLCCGTGAISCAASLLLPSSPDIAPIDNPTIYAQPSTPVVVVAPTQRSGIKPADFATMEPARWHEVAIDPPTPYQNFDAVSALPWARKMARQWIPDAELVRSDIDKMRPDGSLDLASETGCSVGYRFYSPSRAKMAQELSAVSEDVPLTGFRIWISEGVIRAMIADIKAPKTKGWRPVGDTSTCSSSVLMRNHMAQPKTTKRPTYDLGLRWRWGQHMWTISPGDTYYSPTTCDLTKR
ncbi:MAG: hypothetical protein ACI9MC_002043 [Kiritimatiellia bacterium]|jgi:hypothetical protein